MRTTGSQVLGLELLQKASRKLSPLDRLVQLA